MMDSFYKTGYLRYKNKYIDLKNAHQAGGKEKTKTYVDFITKRHNETKRIYTNNDADIIEILDEHFKNINKLICLDFHGVFDLYDDNEKIPSDLPKCVISYIGGNPDTIKNTTNSLKLRVLRDEIILGIIVYNKSETPMCGTKGWILSKILALQTS